MLPIMVINGKAMNESLDIIAEIDHDNKLKVKSIEHSPEMVPFNELLNKFGSTVHNLAMPYWVYTQEFNEASRAYFQKKKEVKRGPFKELLKQKSKNIEIMVLMNSPRFTDLRNSLFSILCWRPISGDFMWYLSFSFPPSGMIISKE
jgi:glutaredoxin 2